MNHNHLLDIGIKKRNREIEDSWDSLAKQYSNGIFHDGESFRMWVKNRLKSQKSQSNHEEGQNFKETIEINKDGSHSSNKLVHMSVEQSKDPNYLLNAHGYDSSVWELISAKSKVWNSYSKKDGILQLYASSISVKPKSDGFSFDKLLDEIHKVTPVYVKSERKEISNKRLLELPFFDQHFGISDYAYYKQTQDDTMELIQSRHWEEILFIIGQDMFHNENFRGQTSSGTVIEKVDVPAAWRDAKQFYFPLVVEALGKSNNVKIVYSKGNHDETMSWSFVQMLIEKFPEVQFDDSFVERKIHTFGEVFIGITHGDKARKNLHNLFPIEFPMEWAKAKTREIHTGHIHKEDAQDWFGMMVRTLATRNKTDNWHKDNGFVGAHKRFMLFEYDENELKTIHYV